LSIKNFIFYIVVDDFVNENDIYGVDIRVAVAGYEVYDINNDW
jgi:hypothetical protein